MENVIVTGASGFLGYHLVLALQKLNVFVYAIVRPNSKTKNRLVHFKNIEIIEMDMNHIMDLDKMSLKNCDCFYHLAWDGGRNDFFAQKKNIDCTLAALEVAKKKHCKTFICTGSQAEYGLYDAVITEDTLPHPNTAYGSAKLSACYLTKIRAEQIGIEWIWARVFSLYGKYDGENCLIPYLIRSLKNGDSPKLTDCRQNWDYLYALDAAEALLCLSERGQTGEIYNVASGDVYPLRFFVEKISKKLTMREMVFGAENRMIVSLNPSIKKLQKHTGWQCRTAFSTGIDEILQK